MKMIKVIVKNSRPDFRVFIDLLFGFESNVDSEGDIVPVFSREWHDLYLKDRESSEPFVELYAEPSLPLNFEIRSESNRLGQLAALYLFLYCGESIEIDGQFLSDSHIEELKLKYSQDLARARESVWHQSNQNNPYPNLT